MHFLDTDIVIDLLRGFPAAITWFESLGDETEAFALPGYVVMELLSWKGINNKQDLLLFYDALAEFSVYWPSPDSCTEAMKDVYSHYLSHSLRPNDALIGHCAKEHSATLYTFNQKHFAVIEGLVTEQPYLK